MRSILILFIIAALGFAIIVKKDAPKSASAPAMPKKRSEQGATQGKRNRVKHPIEETSALGHVAVNERER